MSKAVRRQVAVPASVSSSIQPAVGIPSRGWPTLPGLSSTRRPSKPSREPAPGLIVSSRPSSSM